MAENPIEGEIDKQKIIKEMEQTQLVKIEPIVPEQIGGADTKATTRKFQDEMDTLKMTRKRPREVARGDYIPPIPQQTLWESARAYRKELSILFTLAIGTIWLLIAYMSKEATPLIFAAILVVPTILYIFQNFKRGF